MDIDSSESEPYSESGSEWSGASSSSTTSSSESSNLATTDENIHETEEEAFTITNGYELKDVPKKSTHKVWEQFGILYKTNRIVTKTKDRIFCRKCFDNNTIKR